MGKAPRSLTHHHEMGLRQLALCHWNASFIWNWGPLLFCLLSSPEAPLSDVITLQRTFDLEVAILLFFLILAYQAHFLFSNPQKVCSQPCLFQGTHSVSGSVEETMFMTFFELSPFTECIYLCDLLRTWGLWGQRGYRKDFTIPTESVEKAYSRFMEKQPQVHLQATIWRILTFH